MTWNEKRPAEGEQDPLDQLLAAARWPPPDGDCVGRLRLRWRAVSPARRGKRVVHVTACLAVAAAVAAALLLGWLLPRPATPPGAEAPALEPIAGKYGAPSPFERSPEAPAPAQRFASPEVPEGDVPRAGSLAASRPATAYEVLLFQSLTRAARPAAKTPAEDPVEKAIRQRLTNADADVDRLAEPLLTDRRRHERALAWRVQESAGPRQVAAIELLGRVGSRQSVPLLIELSRHDATHAAAIRALARVADAQTVAALADAEAAAALQQELFASLITRGDGPSLAAYLACVRSPATSEAALAALDRANSVPVERLFEFFNSPRQSERFAAAVVLGRLDDPEIPRRLIRMVARDTRRREAMVALVASSDRQAVRFVSLAERDPALKALLSEARFHAELTIP